MALVVEDGTGKVDSDAYVTIAAADTYWTNRGITAWAVDDEAKEIAIRKATDYLEQRYRSLWVGQRATLEQALSWPRLGVVVDGFDVPANMIPTEVRRATIELAYRAVTADLFPDVAATSGEVIKEKLGDMEIQYSAGSGTGASGTLYRTVSGWIAPFMENGLAGIRSTKVERA